MSEVNLHIANIDGESMGHFIHEHSEEIRRAVNAGFESLHKRNPERDLEYLQQLQTEEADAFDEIRRREGSIQTWVRGSHVQITVRLRRRWARAIAKLPTEESFRRACSICDFWLKAAVIAGVIYLALEVGVAFLPGGAVERVLGGAR